jgi:hypothetical protein
MKGPEMSDRNIAGEGATGTQIDLAKLRTVGVLGRRSGNVVREGRRADGVRVKATTDELGNTVTEHARGDRQDVTIRPAAINLKMGVQ